MKKLKKILFICIIMVFVSIIDVDAAGVSIKSIRLIDHTGSATEISEPKVSGLNINFDLAFADLGDSAIYEVVLNNPTNKEYEINTEKKFGPSNFISYTYELKDKTNVIKANSEVTLNVIIKYENAVSPDKLVDGKYVENNDMGINLLNEDNPDTFNNFLFIILMIVLMGVATLVFKYTKDKGLYIIILSLLLVPFTVFAVEKIKLTIGTKIMIAQKHGVYYHGYELVRNREGFDDCNLISSVMINNNTLYQCYVIKEDSKTYFEGERVKVDDLVVLALNSSSCAFDNVRKEYNCTEDAFVNSTASIFEYYCPASETEFPCNEIEHNKFNFNSVISKEWDGDNSRIKFKSPNEFTMPNYDVGFEFTYENGVPEVGLS